MIRRFYLCSLLTLALGCSGEPAAPPAAEPSAVKFWEAGATVHWNAIAREETRTGTLNVFTGARMLAYLSLAQYTAALEAKAARDLLPRSRRLLRDRARPAGVGRAVAR